MFRLRIVAPEGDSAQSACAFVGALVEL